jgi:hypothetical protein
MLAWMLLLVMAEKEEEKYSTWQNTIRFPELVNFCLFVCLFVCLFFCCCVAQRHGL